MWWWMIWRVSLLTYQWRDCAPPVKEYDFCINISVLTILIIRFVFLYIVLSVTGPTYETSYVYNNKGIRCDDEEFEVYQRFHSSQQTLYHRLKNTTFGIVRFRKDLQVHSKNQMLTKYIGDQIGMFLLIIWIRL